MSADPRAQYPHAAGRLELRDGLAIAFEQRGSGPWLLLIHGFTGSGSSWPEPVANALASEFSVLLVDLIGHGQSDRPHEPKRFEMAEVVEDLCQLLDLHRAEGAAWVGYSMGARIALGAGVLRPERVRALVLEGGSPGLAKEEERRARRSSDEALAQALERDGIEPFVDRWMQQPLFSTQRELDAEVREAQRRQRLGNDPHALAACLRGLGTGVQPTLWDALPALEPPALLLAGERDQKFCELTRQMAERIQRPPSMEPPSLLIATIPGAGHTTHLERPDGYLEHVLPFLRTWGTARALARKRRSEP